MRRYRLTMAAAPWAQKNPGNCTEYTSPAFIGVPELPYLGLTVYVETRRNPTMQPAALHSQLDDAAPTPPLRPLAVKPHGLLRGNSGFAAYIVAWSNEGNLEIVLLLREENGAPISIIYHISKPEAGAWAAVSSGSSCETTTRAD